MSTSETKLLARIGNLQAKANILQKELENLSWRAGELLRETAKFHANRVAQEAMEADGVLVDNHVNYLAWNQMTVDMADAISHERDEKVLTLTTLNNELVSLIKEHQS